MYDLYKTHALIYYIDNITFTIVPEYYHHVIIYYSGRDATEQYSTSDLQNDWDGCTTGNREGNEGQQWFDIHRGIQGMFSNKLQSSSVKESNITSV